MARISRKQTLGSRALKVGGAVGDAVAGPASLAFKLALAGGAVLGFASFVGPFIGDSELDHNLEKALNAFNNVADVSLLPEGTCYYIDPEKEEVVTFVKRNTSQFENFWRAVSPFHEMIDNNPVEVGTLPVIKSGQCNLYNSDVITVFQKEADAWQLIAEERAAMGEKIRELIEEHGWKNELTRDIRPIVLPKPETPSNG